MESFPLFFKIRAITFSCILVFSFIWLVLLSIEMFTRWDISDHISRSLMILFVLTNTVTIIMLPILILVQFRAWLDAARLFLLLILQLGSAAAFTYWNSQIQCPNQTPDVLGVCQLINMYTMMACWIIPAILVLYSIYFAVIVYRQSRIPVVVEPQPRKTRRDLDPEMSVTDIPSFGSLSTWKGKMKEATEASVLQITTDMPQKQPLPVPLRLPAMVPRRHTIQPSSSEPTLLDPPRRQSSLAMAAMSRPPVPPLPSIQRRHLSLPPPRHGYGQHRPMMTLAIPPPFALHSQHAPSPCSSHSSYSTPSPLTAQGPPVVLRPGVSEARSSRDSRESRRHLSMMPLPSSPSETHSVEDSGLPRTRARLSKPAPMHFM